MSLQIVLVWDQVQATKNGCRTLVSTSWFLPRRRSNGRITIVWRHLPESLRKPIYPGLMRDPIRLLPWKFHLLAGSEQITISMREA
jgi:hypothetical protein